MKTIHPFWAAFEAKKKLEAAKKEGARRRQKKWHRENDDEFTKLLARTRARVRRGIPLELPKMKGWDYKKGRVL